MILSPFPFSTLPAGWATWEFQAWPCVTACRDPGSAHRVCDRQKQPHARRATRLSSFHKDSRQTWYATGRLLLVVRGKPGATDHAGTAAGLAQEPPTPRAYDTVLLLTVRACGPREHQPFPQPPCDAFPRLSWRPPRCLIRHGGDCSVSSLPVGPPLLQRIQPFQTQGRPVLKGAFHLHWFAVSIIDDGEGDP